MDKQQQFIDKPYLIKDIADEECISVSCGFRHTLILTDTGKVYGIGTNKRNELGLGNSAQ